MAWREKESSIIIKAVQMDNLRVLLGMRRPGRMPNVVVSCGKNKGVNQRNNECSRLIYPS